MAGSHVEDYVRPRLLTAGQQIAYSTAAMRNQVAWQNTPKVIVV